ncbi:MAG TPA: helix-turn-helix domain-containing protein [Pirellulales bacterium]|jgi:excisionase family DNA binding protein|nr:helix-turn-helix domain-containing protein [Pirellulales bacterium]
MERILLTVNQTANTLGISPRTLWTLTKEQAIPVIRIGRRVLYAITDIQRFIDGQRISSKYKTSAMGVA